MNSPALPVFVVEAAAFGYEHRALEAWVYPMKLLDNFHLSFKIEGYPLEFTDQDTAVRINVRPMRVRRWRRAGALAL